MTNRRPKRTTNRRPKTTPINKKSTIDNIVEEILQDLKRKTDTILQQNTPKIFADTRSAEIKVVEPDQYKETPLHGPAEALLAGLTALLPVLDDIIDSLEGRAPPVNQPQASDSGVRSLQSTLDITVGRFYNVQEMVHRIHYLCQH